MTVNDIKEILTSFGWEYKINENGRIISSSNYDKITKNMIYDDVFNFNNKYYKNKVKSIQIGEKLYRIEYLEDITKYIEFVMALKKDKLTGLATREHLEEYISSLNRQSVFVMCDIDDFKMVNDIYGHQIGDHILNLLGGIIRRNIRKNDFAGRYGGEEFLIIFDTDNVESVKERIDKINKEFSKNSLNLNLSFSAGISIYDGKTKISEVIKQADMALYYVKQNGKNNSIIFDKKMMKGEKSI